MQSKNWQTIKEVLSDVLQIEPARRTAFLDKIAPNAEIRAEIESLLDCDQASADFMSLPVTDYSKDFTVIVEAETPLVGQRIGVYKIVREIGSGGMGAVYLATRADGKFEQKVAVKMLRREYNSEKIRGYFRREKEIQARLNHPNIARLLDAGTTNDGIPFLVMEYIEGLPVDKFCECNELSLNERLNLFNRVCDGVMHAHRNLTVHRDLKPSNILVTEDGEPKLLDFGISKLLDTENFGDKHTTTLKAMTPEYASPEQINGKTVTTSTDIYSLGVILYKLLTAAHPFDLDGKTNGEMLEIITRSEPIRPSLVNFKVSTYKKNITQSFKGDLDNIILKSLAKEPERRYQTVEQFSADIWRFIDGLPILARPSTLSYQARKFYGRNKITVLAGVLVFVSLLMGLTVSLWQTNVAHGQAKIAAESQRLAEIETERAVAEEAKALAEKEKAEKISQFMFKVLAYANPRWYAEGAKFKGETKVIEAMDELSDEIDIEFANQSDIQSELHHKFAQVYNNNIRLGRETESQAKELYHARRALELRKQFYGDYHELVAKDLAYLYWSGGADKKDEAKLLFEAIQMMRDTNPHNLNLPYMLEAYTARLMMPGFDEETHNQYQQAIIPSSGENKYQIAEKYLLESLLIFREHYSVDNLSIYMNECKLAYSQFKQNKFAEAAPHFEICQSAESKLQDENQKKIVKKFTVIIKK